MFQSKLVFVAIVSVVSVFPKPIFAQEFEFYDFSDLSYITLNGFTAGIGNPTLYQDQFVLRLTNDLWQNGSAFYSEPISLRDTNNRYASFSAYIMFQITNPRGLTDIDGMPGADGMSFVIATSPYSLGGNGGSLGYEGIKRSLGIEIDTWNNTSSRQDTNDGNHIALDFNGFVQSVKFSTVANPLNNGNVWIMWIEYDGISDLLEISLSETTDKPENPNLTYTVSIVSILGQNQAYFGFTSGTGAACNDHDILYWSFNSWFDALNQPPQITHTPITSTLQNQDIQIHFVAEDEENNLASVELFYRKTGDAEYQSVGESSNRNGEYTLTIPASVVQIPGVNYYLEAKDIEGAIKTTPVYHVSVIDKWPVIIIPGVMGSELRDAETNELFWLDPDKAIQANDPWLLALSLQSDGITPDTNSRCVNGWEKLCDENNECASHSCAPGGRNLIAKDILNIDDFILKGYTEYKKLVKFLGENNYTFREDVFLHAYDWRRDLGEIDENWSAVKFLRNMIVEIAPTPNDRVNIIAHSMGGLVMRSYLAYYSDDHRIETVIYLGTPHSGSPGTYAILMGYYKLINDKELLLSSINAVTSTFICQNFPGMYQLLPRDPFVTQEGVGGLTLDETYQNLPNSTLVEKARDFHNFIKDFNPIERSFAINGSGLATFSTVRIETKVKTHEECIWAFTGNGDNTVPQRSSSSLIGDREYFVKGKHAELPGNEAAHKKILKILQGKENDPDDPSEVKTTPFELGKTWNWTSCCPINLEITDFEDNVNGVDKENNDIRQDISESGFFSFPNNESGFMPYDNEYRIKITAFNDGEFTLTLNLVEPDESISKTLVFSDVPIGNKSTGDLVLSPDTDNVILSLDVEGDGVADYELTANAEVPTELRDRFSERGDFNKDKDIDISDGVAILSFLFLGGEASCKLAGDTNKDDAIDVSDAIYLLSFLFLGGEEISQENVLCE